MARGFVSKEQVKSWLKEAHDHCKREVPITRHPVGKGGRFKWGRNREAYLECIRAYISKKMEDALKAKGYKVGA